MRQSASIIKRFTCIVSIVCLCALLLSANTIASDTMLRTGALGSNWTAIEGVFTCDTTNGAANTIVGNSLSGAFWNANSFPNDQWSQVTLTNIAGASNSGIGVIVRGSGSGGTSKYYDFFAYQGTGRYLRKEVNGAVTSIANDAVVPQVGDVMYLEIQGTTLVAKVNGVVIFTQTDTDISTGSAGLGGFSSGTPATFNKADNWSGGDFLGGSVPRKTAGVF